MPEDLNFGIVKMVIFLKMIDLSRKYRWIGAELLLRGETGLDGVGGDAASALVERNAVGDADGDGEEAW